MGTRITEWGRRRFRYQWQFPRSGGTFLRRLETCPLSLGAAGIPGKRHPGRCQFIDVKAGRREMLRLENRRSTIARRNPLVQDVNCRQQGLTLIDSLLGGLSARTKPQAPQALHLCHTQDVWAGRDRNIGFTAQSPN